MGYRLSSEQIPVADNLEAVNRLFLEKGWGDGLPIVPPTEEAVARLLSGTKRDPAEVITEVPPLCGEATVEKIAINAVMAGCLPEYLPVIIAAVAAMCEQQLNLFGVQNTTHPAGILLIVNGPIARKLQINGKSGAFGPCWRANATIGRAIRLIQLNLGGAIPGKIDMATQGQPCKYTFCIAENEEENPWESLHVEKGFPVTASTVTTIAAENPHNINEHSATTAEEVLTTIASVVATMGHNNVLSQLGEPLIALGPEHAATIARDGFSKDDIREFLYKKTKIPIGNFVERVAKRRFPDLPKDALVPVTPKKENIMLIVVGGPGKHSAFLPTFGETRSVTKAIE